MAVTDKPIIMYADKKIYKFNPDAAALIEKRGLFADSEDVFFEKINAFMQLNDWELPKPVNMEFAEQYVTHINDGKASERLADFMHQLIRDKK
jgi:hypothetical protein